MSETQLILELIGQLQTNFQVLNDHSGELTMLVAEVATKVEILMWLTGVLVTAMIGLFVERVSTLLVSRNNKNNGK